MRTWPVRRLGVVLVTVAVGVAASTAAVGLLEAGLGVPNASSVYVVAVAAAAIVVGMLGAVLTAVVGIVVYDVLFTEPRYTFAVSDPGEWLNLVLLLFVAVTVGQLAAVGRRRAEAAVAREREARALFEVTRALAARESTLAALPAVAAAVARDAGMTRAWFALGADDANERVVGDGGTPSPAVRGYAVLHTRGSADDYSWTIVRSATAGRPTEAGASQFFRVRITEGGRPIGSLWCTRPREHGHPDAATSRLLRVTADLVGQSMAHDRYEEERRRAEVAQQSDALKSALLESVSHDLRTPLASIRAFAGTLMDPAVELNRLEARQSAASIDREAEHLNRLVGNLLDLSRIEAGSLRVASDALDVDDVVAGVLRRVDTRAANRRLEVEVADGTAVLGDAVLVEQVVVNLLDNAIQHSREGAIIRVAASATDGAVHLTVEDSGPGVPDQALPRLFDKFFRVPGRRGHAAGTGVGLAVVRGFVEAMGGQATARRSTLGGLAVDVTLPEARLPAAAATG